MNTTAEQSYIARPGVKGKGIVVIVHRYSQPSDRFGVHELYQRPPEEHELLTRFDKISLALTRKRAPRWTNNTVGLFSHKPEMILQGFNQLTAMSITAAGGSKPPGLVLLATNEFESIMQFVGDQIIPLEWKQQWADGDPEIRSRVEVWV